MAESHILKHCKQFYKEIYVMSLLKHYMQYNSFFNSKTFWYIKLQCKLCIQVRSLIFFNRIHGYTMAKKVFSFLKFVKNIICQAITLFLFMFTSFHYSYICLCTFAMNYLFFYASITFESFLCFVYFTLVIVSINCNYIF